MQKPFGIQKCDIPTFRLTDTASSRVACPRLKTEPSMILTKKKFWPAFHELDNAGTFILTQDRTWSAVPDALLGVIS